MVFILDKFWSYLLGFEVLIYSNHAALGHLLTKKNTKPWLIRCILFLQQFNLEIQDKKWFENMVVDHISRIIFEHPENIEGPWTNS